MSKKAIAILLGIGFGLGVIGLVMVIVGVAVGASACDPECGGSTGQPFPSGALAAMLIGLLLLLSGLIVGIVSWVGALVKQAKQQQWGWFAGTLASGLIASYLSGICILIYLIVVPEQQPVLPGYLPMQPYQAGVLYQPMPAYRPGDPYQAVPPYPAADPYQDAPQYPPNEVVPPQG